MEAVIEKLLSIKSIAALVDVSVPTLRRQILLGHFPKPDISIGQQHRWRESTIAKWMSAGRDVQ